ncbi:MAG: BREX system ATP-binding domain-containing protein [Terriglobia bacterium]
MTAAIDPKEWLRFVEREYLAGFIRDGGSSIKFAVPLDDNIRPELFDALTRLAEQSGYLFVRIDAADTKVHMVDEVFFRAAEHVPWRGLSGQVIAKLAAEAGYAWPSSPKTDDPLYIQLADENKVEPKMILLDVKKAIGSRVFKQRELAKDFRIAMTHLCIAELSGGQDGVTTTKVLIEWLTGQNKAVSPVKQYQIFRRINRTTARYFFESLVHWIRFAGCSGVVICLDTARVALVRNPHDQGVYYSKAAVLDSYEVLREFIDGVDDLKGCLMVVVPDIAFLEDHSRGISAYEALKFRVFDEVRDKRLVNPMASLVRLSGVVRGN